MLPVFLQEFWDSLETTVGEKFAMSRRRKCCPFFLQNFWLHSTTTVLANFLLKVEERLSIFLE